MINNSALSMTMDVAQLAPKAATVQPVRGDGAFGEALAGAHSVHDRRESQQSAAPARRELERGDRAATPQAGEASRSEPSDRTSATDRTDSAPATDDVRSQRGDSASEASAAADTSTGDDATTSAATDTEGAGQPTADDAAGAPDASADADAAAAATPAEGTTSTPGVAVAAAPVQADLDAIIVPTTTRSAQATTDAVDAAIRMAIQVEAPVGQQAAIAGDAAVATTVDPDPPVATTPVQGAEDAVDGDVQAGPTSPSTSRPTSASGPSPAQLAAATFAPVDEGGDQQVAAPVVQRTAEVAAAPVQGIAEGDAPDAARQVVQAAAVELDGPATEADPVATTAAGAVKVAAKVEQAVDPAAAPTGDVVEADVPEAVHAARLNQQQPPTVAAAAQHQAAVQAKAAERAAEQQPTEAAPAKAEPLPPAQAAAPVTAAREGTQAVRVREGLLTAHQQQRIDHIAEQLATRLRLSHAAGGSQVQLSLKPRELGDVTVQMQVREGVVAATILVDKADTARTMQASIEDLKRSLEQQGLSIQEFSVDVRGEAGAGGANARAAAELRQGAATSGQGSTSPVAGAAAAMPGFDGDDVVTTEDVHDGDVSVLV
jgi:flagellar hook-length control protein FliK